MNSLAMETLLDVDEERPSPKALKRALAKDASEPVLSYSKQATYRMCLGRKDREVARNDTDVYAGLECSEKLSDQPLVHGTGAPGQ